MLKHCFLFLYVFASFLLQAQVSHLEAQSATKDSLKRKAFIQHLGNGYFPTKYFNFDLRYLVKYNQYEALRTGLGGITNDALSKSFKINGYLVYGFGDDKFKYSVGGAYRVAEKTNTWISVSYTDDLQETGSTKFLTDKRFFQFFEPRLLNINLFHEHLTKSLEIEHQFTPKLISETEFSVINIDPTYNYTYIGENRNYSEYNISSSKFALQWSPFSTFNNTDHGLKEVKKGFPKFTIQYTKSFKDVFKSDFNFSKVDFRTIYQFGNEKTNHTQIIVVAGIANGDIPLSHLYHAYPNNINKETVLQRFSVAGINSFETMFFNEFFSDKFTTLQIKHYFKPFNISQSHKPQMVLITRYALGSMTNPQRHQNISFNTLDKGYTETGFELNKLLFGFGLSFTYRYGAYHLPDIEDNIALKFTFNVTL
ncbi:hypothetical protein [Aestuariibaculum sediminum]|uniref:Uncharacterized protein n=1 Tax=Aestuariibaculum sediminum TaxID=2770637 RepID=A0A8J6U9Q4_9FLAO|nr:hypothetical protein [Aestuariibaculum sediminum]MBD0833522.1 hypothetical protein [Aestuariibaculum sediminum]